MGTINRGILGGFRGKVGNVVGFFWKGQAVMRSLAGSVSNPRTYGQLVARARFSLAGSLMASCSSFSNQTITLPTSFSSTQKRKSKINVVMQRALAALQTSGTDATLPTGYNVDWSNFVIDEGLGDGRMIAPGSPGVTYDIQNRKIMFSWTDNSTADASVAGSDVIVLVAIPSDRKADGLFQFKFGLLNDGDYERRDTAGFLTVPNITGVTTMECYVIARNAGNTQRSVSFYCGSINV